MSKLFRNVPFLTSLEMSPFVWFRCCFLVLLFFLLLAFVFVFVVGLPGAKPCERLGRSRGQSQRRRGGCRRPPPEHPSPAEEFFRKTASTIPFTYQAATEFGRFSSRHHLGQFSSVCEGELCLCARRPSRSRAPVFVACHDRREELRAELALRSGICRRSARR
jgi:hypothetical protein